MAVGVMMSPWPSFGLRMLSVGDVASANGRMVSSFLPKDFTDCVSGGA